MNESLVGTRRLVRLILRRDRIRLTLWVFGLVALMAVSAQSIASLYDTEEEIATYVDTVGDNPALIVFAGPGYGFDDPNAGVILVNETELWMALGCALMSVFLVNRHTRAEEESERADLVRSMVVGRHAPVAATMLVAAGANVAVAVGSALGTLAFGFPLVGTFALCASFGAIGLVFAAVTAIAVQVASTGRGALGLAAGLVGLAFVVRGVGDVSLPGLSWTTPFGWAIGVRAYAHERWWTLFGLLAFTLGFIWFAFALSIRRDLGSGLLGQHGGPAQASSAVTHPLGLAARLQRGSIIGWAIGLFLTGLVYGSVANDIEDMVADNPALADYLAKIAGASLSEAYLATTLRLVALAIGGFAIASALRNRSEEAAGYAESMLATSVSRWWWAGSHLVVTVAASALLVAVTGLGMGVGYAAAIGEPAQMPRLTLAALATLPAVLVLAGVATVLFGWLPHRTAAAWVALALIAVVDIFATLLDLPHWMTMISPLEHAPLVPAQGWRAMPLVILTLLAVFFAGAGLWGFRRRDLTSA